MPHLFLLSQLLLTPKSMLISKLMKSSDPKIKYGMTCDSEHSGVGRNFFSKFPVIFHGKNVIM